MPNAFLIIMTFWLAAAFAIFLILELGNPFEGRIVPCCCGSAMLHAMTV